MKDTKLILKGVGLYENFREEVMQSELQERLQEYIEVIPEAVVVEEDNYILFDDEQVLYWEPAPVDKQDEISEILTEIHWCAEFLYSDRVQDLIWKAQRKIAEL